MLWILNFKPHRERLGHVQPTLRSRSQVPQLTLDQVVHLRLPFRPALLLHDVQVGVLTLGSGLGFLGKRGVLALAEDLFGEGQGILRAYGGGQVHHHVAAHTGEHVDDGPQVAQGELRSRLVDASRGELVDPSKQPVGEYLDEWLQASA